MNIRHSSLPKLALCGQYESKSEISAAAYRGTKLDTIFREAWVTGEIPTDLADEEATVVMWAINALLRCRTSDADIVATSEHLCKVRTPGMQHVGTADAVCVHGRWLADLKTGQIYDYKAQMAAYALGLMHEHLVDRWTAHLLFADQQEIVTYSFTYAEADYIVQAVLKNVGTAPVINDYCGWCAHSLTCLARVEANKQALAVPANEFPALLADPVRLGEFLTRCRTFDAFREAAETEARRLLGEGVEVPGWRLQKPRVTEFVDAEVLVGAVQSGLLDAGAVIRAQGSLSATKARKLWADVPVARKESKPALVAK
jgi:hypothetical protein